MTSKSVGKFGSGLELSSNSITSEYKRASDAIVSSGLSRGLSPTNPSIYVPVDMDIVAGGTNTNKDKKTVYVLVSYARPDVTTTKADLYLDANSASETYKLFYQKNLETTSWDLIFSYGELTRSLTYVSESTLSSGSGAADLSGSFNSSNGTITITGGKNPVEIDISSIDTDTYPDDMSFDTSTGALSWNIKDKAGSVLRTETVDLPKQSLGVTEATEAIVEVSTSIPIASMPKSDASVLINNPDVMWTVTLPPGSKLTRFNYGPTGSVTSTQSVTTAEETFKIFGWNN